VRNLAFVPAGEGKPPKILVSGSFDKTVRFWDLKSGKELKNIVINHPGPTTALAVTRDGKFLATGSHADSHIILWQVEDAKEVRRWKAHQGGVTGLAFGPDGKTIASSGNVRKQTFPRDPKDPEDDYGLALWETGTGKTIQTFAGHTTAVWGMALSTDGKLLASCGIDKVKGRSVLLWDPATGNQLRALQGSFVGLDARCLAISPDGKTIAAPEFTGISFFDTAGGAEQRGLPRAGGDVQTLVFSPDGLTLAAAGRAGRIALWDVQQRTAKLAGLGHSQALTSVAVSPDGKTIVTTSSDGTAWLWDRTTSKPLHELNRQKVQGGILIWCAAFSPDSKTVALSHQRAGITFWSAASGQLQRQIQDASQDRIVSVMFSPDGKFLASESIDQPNACLWNVATGDLVRRLPRGGERYMDRGHSVAISPDGQFVASAGSKGLFVWTLDSGKLVYQQPAGALSVAYSPGGFLLATAGFGVKLHDAATGKEIAKFDGQLHQSAWRAIAFSPDGRLLAVAETTRVRLWDIAARRELRSFDGHRGSVTSVAFTPDGKALVSAAEDSTALIWDLAGVLPAEKASEPKMLWDDLGNNDRIRAYAAFCRLRATPDDAITMLKKHLQPTAPVPFERVADLIKKLDDETVKVRETAFEELEKIGLPAEKVLIDARTKSPSNEATRRLNKLLSQIDTGVHWQRDLAGLKLLEEFNSTASRELLQNLAKGDADVRLTREANIVLQRVLKRGNEP
jgi:WD40 repeat protein